MTDRVVATYHVPKSFKSRLRSKPHAMQAKVLEAVDELVRDPSPGGKLQVHRVVGHPRLWTASVDHANRVTFEREGGTLWFRVHCHHDHVYRNPSGT